MESLTVFGEPLKPWIYAILFKAATTSTWTGLTGRTHLWAQFRILSQPKSSMEKTPAFLCGKMRLLAQSWRNLLQIINNRSIENCVQRPRLVYVRAVRFTSAHLTQISRGSLNAFGPFRKLKNKTRTFPETKSSGGNNQQGPLASTPQQIAELFNSYFVSVFTAPSEVRTLSAPFTPSHPT